MNPLEVVKQQQKDKMVKEMDAARKEIRERAVQEYCQQMYDVGIPSMQINLMPIEDNGPHCVL